MALSAYRTLLRSARIAFEGDLRTLIGARHAARQAFETNRHLALDSKEVADQLHHAQDVARILRENVVQGKKIEGKESTYKLRIHEHTELGDNESVKTAGKGTLGGAKCGCS